MPKRIQMKCESCHKIHDLPKTSELPEHVFIMHCNWCPCCEGSVDAYYEEWWDDNENNPGTEPIPVGDNQLVMPFIFDELEIPKHQHQLTQ